MATSLFSTNEETVLSSITTLIYLKDTNTEKGERNGILNKHTGFVQGNFKNTNYYLFINSFFPFQSCPLITSLNA